MKMFKAIEKTLMHFYRQDAKDAKNNKAEIYSSVLNDHYLCSELCVLGVLAVKK